MASLLLLIIFGLGMAYFATQNTGAVHVLVANYLISGIPMYLVVIISLLLGIFISWLISVVGTVSSTFTIHGKDHEIKKSHEEIQKLQEKIHNLEIENAKINKNTSPRTPLIEEEHNPTLAERIKHTFT